MWWCFWTFAQCCGFDFNKTVKCLAGCAIKQARITFYKMHEVLTFIYLSVGSLNDPMLCICMCFAGVLRLKLFFAFLPALDGFGVYPSLMQLPTVSRRTSRGTAHIIIGWRDQICHKLGSYDNVVCIPPHRTYNKSICFFSVYFYHIWYKYLTRQHIP